MDPVPSNDVFTLWNFHVAAQNMFEKLTPSKGKRKTKYQYDKELAHSAPSHISSSFDEIIDTKIGHVDMVDF